MSYFPEFPKNFVNLFSFPELTFKSDAQRSEFDAALQNFMAERDNDVDTIILHLKSSPKALWDFKKLVQGYTPEELNKILEQFAISNEDLNSETFVPAHSHDPLIGLGVDNIPIFKQKQ